MKMSDLTITGPIIRPHRIKLPSPPFQWRKYEREKMKTSATGGAMRADLFHGGRFFIDPGSSDAFNYLVVVF